MNFLPSDALATDFLRITINKRYSQHVYRYYEELPQLFIVETVTSLSLCIQNRLNGRFDKLLEIYNCLDVFIHLDSFFCFHYF